MTKEKLTRDQWLEIVKKIESGESIANIAKEYGISGKTVYNRLGRDASPGSNSLELSRLKRENKELKEIIGIITHELNKEKKLV